MHPSTYNEQEHTTFERKLVKRTIDFFKGRVNEVYKITKVVFKSGVVKRIVIGFISLVFFFAVKLAILAPNSSVPEVGLGSRSPSQTEIVVSDSSSSSKNEQINHQTIQSPSVQKLLDLNIRGGDLNGNPGNPGSRARGDLKSGKHSKKNSGSGLGVEAFEPMNPSRRLHTVASEQNGLFGRFTGRRPTIDPSNTNPGCAGGSNSITVWSVDRGQGTELQATREITAHDGTKGSLTDKSQSHIAAKHGHSINISETLPSNPNQKHSQVRTRVNFEIKKELADCVENILVNPETKVYVDTSIRGTTGQVYVT